MVPGTHSHVTPIQPGRITRPCTTGVTRVDKVTRIAPLLHGRTTRPCNTARVIQLCVSAFIGKAKVTLIVTHQGAPPGVKCAVCDCHVTVICVNYI